MLFKKADKKKQNKKNKNKQTKKTIENSRSQPKLKNQPVTEDF